MPSTVGAMKLNYDTLSLVAQQLPSKERLYLCIANKTLYDMAYNTFFRDDLLDALSPLRVLLDTKNALHTAMKRDSVTRLESILEYVNFASAKDAYSKWGSLLPEGLLDGDLDSFWATMTFYCAEVRAVKCLVLLINKVTRATSIIQSNRVAFLRTAVEADVQELVESILNIARVGSRDCVRRRDFGELIAMSKNARMVHGLFQLGDAYLSVPQNRYLGDRVRFWKQPIEFDHMLALTRNAEVAATIFQCSKKYLRAKPDWGRFGRTFKNHHYDFNSKRRVNALLFQCRDATVPKSLIRTMVEHGYPYDTIPSPLDVAASYLNCNAVTYLLELGASVGGSFDFRLRNRYRPTTPLEFMMEWERVGAFDLWLSRSQPVTHDKTQPYARWLNRVQDFCSRMIPIVESLIGAGTVEFAKKQRWANRGLFYGYDVLGKFVEFATELVTQGREYLARTGASFRLRINGHADNVETLDADAGEELDEARDFKLLGDVCNLLVDAGAGWTKRSARMLAEVTPGSTGPGRMLELVAIQAARNKETLEPEAVRKKETWEWWHHEGFVWDDDEGVWVKRGDDTQS